MLAQWAIQVFNVGIWKSIELRQAVSEMPRIVVMSNLHQAHFPTPQKSQWELLKRCNCWFMIHVDFNYGNFFLTSLLYLAAEISPSSPICMGTAMASFRDSHTPKPSTEWSTEGENVARSWFGVAHVVEEFTAKGDSQAWYWEVPFQISNRLQAFYSDLILFEDSGVFYIQSHVRKVLTGANQTEYQEMTSP